MGRIGLVIDCYRFSIAVKLLRRDLIIENLK